MTNVLPKINLQDFTKLPLKELIKAENMGTEITVNTPHKGTVLIPTKEGWLFKTEVDGKDIVSQILILEREAKEFLLDQWLTLISKHE